MNYSLGDLDRQRALDIQTTIWKGNHKFKDIHAELDWSKTTVSKYLEVLKNEGVIEKGLTSDEKIGYFFTDEGKIYFENKNLAEALTSELTSNELLDHQSDINAFIEELDERGAFNEGIDEQDMIELLRWSTEVDQPDEPNGQALKDFFHFAIALLEPKIWDKEVECNFKIKCDKADLEKDVGKLEEAMQELDWPRED